MALGTVTKVTGANYVSGNKRVRVFDIQVTSGANYTTGGETITAAQVGLRFRIDQANVLASPRGAGGAISSIGVDYGTAGSAPSSVKLLAYFSTTGAADTQVSSNTDLSGYTVRVAFTGA